MDLWILDQEFKKVAIIDTYESLIWSDRYAKPGDFELYTPVSTDVLTYPVANNYLQTTESEHTMIVEDITITSDTEDGNHIKIVGRSLESILGRRIIWEDMDLTGNLQDAFEKLLNACIISPTDADRKISNFIFERSTDEAIVAMTTDSSCARGDNLLEVVQTLCAYHKIGFKILLNDNNQFVFSLYRGTDRSYNQETLPWVVFKPSFENVIASDYAENNSEAKTVLLAHSTHGENNDDILRTVGGGSGLLRKECFEEISIENGEDLSDTDYKAKMDEEANTKLSEYKVKKTFEGEFETTRMFVYKKDFEIGDLVEISNEYGINSTARITEFIYSQEKGEYKRYPTFEADEYTENN